MLLIAGNMLPVSRQHVSLCIQQQTGNNFIAGNMLLQSSSNIVAGQHDAMV